MGTLTLPLTPEQAVKLKALLSKKLTVKKLVNSYNGGNASLLKGLYFDDGFLDVVETLKYDIPNLDIRPILIAYLNASVDRFLKSPSDFTAPYSIESIKTIKELASISFNNNTIIYKG